MPRSVLTRPIRDLTTPWPNSSRGPTTPIPRPTPDPAGAGRFGGPEGGIHPLVSPPTRGRRVHGASGAAPLLATREAIAMAQGRWTRMCQDCGWVEPGASYPSKEFAEPNVDAGFGDSSRAPLDAPSVVRSTSRASLWR